MTQNEYNELRELRQRLYGGPLDGERGDIVTIKSDIADIKATINGARGAISLVKGASVLFGTGGVLTILRAVLGG